MQEIKSEVNQKKNQITFWLNAKIYPLEVIYATAYVFIDRAYAYVGGDPKKEIKVSLTGKEKLSNKNLESLRGEFLNELLNYLLRVEIAKRNKKIREFIVSSALVAGLENDLLFASAGDGVKKSGDWQNDPLGIAIPWEGVKKNADKKTKKAKAKKRKAAR